MATAADMYKAAKVIRFNQCRMSTAVNVCPHTELPLSRGSGDHQQQGFEITDFSIPPSENAAGALVCSEGLPPQIHFHPFGPREREVEP